MWEWKMEGEEVGFGNVGREGLRCDLGRIQ